MNKAYPIFLIICIAIIAICYYLWFSPLFMTIACFLAICDIIWLIGNISTKSDNLAEKSGCLVAFVIGLLLVIAFFMNSKYHISSFGDQRHLYSDCQKMKGGDDHEVRKLSAIIWGCIDDCETCTSRHKAEVEKAYQEFKRKKAADDLQFIEEQIKELMSVREDLLNGHDVDVEDYEFRRDVEDDIREEAIEDYRDADYEPRGRL